MILITLLEATVLPKIETNDTSKTWNFTNGRRKIEVFFANTDKTVYIRKFNSVDSNYEIASVVELQLAEYNRLLRFIALYKQPKVELWGPEIDD